MDKRETIVRELSGKLKLLSCRASGFVFALSAYRLLPYYRQFETEHCSGGLLELKSILDDMFDDAISDGIITASESKAREKSIFEHTPDSDKGISASLAQPFCVVLYEANRRLSVANGEPPMVNQNDEIDYCLSPLIAKIGLEMFGCTNPGNADSNFVDKFYDSVTADNRFQEELSNLIRDIDTLGSYNVNLSKEAVKLRNSYL